MVIALDETDRAASMSDIIIIAFAALIFWAVSSAVLHRLGTVDETLLSVFKLMLQHRDIDPDTVPDAALIDIIAATNDEAKQMALESGRGLRDGWKRYLLRLLDKEADLVERVMREGPGGYMDQPSAQILLKYGTVEPVQPKMSVEEFQEAARRGTLYAELDERVARRELS